MDSFLEKFTLICTKKQQTDVDNSAQKQGLTRSYPLYKPLSRNDLCITRHFDPSLSANRSRIIHSI